jgi:hypothetical protein
MKKRFAVLFILVFLFQCPSALGQSDDLEQMLWCILFPTAYGDSETNKFVNDFSDLLFYKEPEPGMRILSELAVYPDEETDTMFAAGSTGSFDPDVFKNDKGFLSFGGSDGWAYVNARCYPDHEDVNERVYLYIGFCVQGKGDRIIGTPELVIRLKNWKKTKPVSIKKLEIEINNQRYTFNNSVQQNDSSFFYLGHTGEQLLQELAGLGIRSDPNLEFVIYFDPLFFTGSDLTDYPESISDHLKTGDRYFASDSLRDYPLAEMARNIVESKLYDCIGADVLQNADKKHNATVEKITDQQ